MDAKKDSSPAKQPPQVDHVSSSVVKDGGRDALHSDSGIFFPIQSSFRYLEMSQQEELLPDPSYSYTPAPNAVPPYLLGQQYGSDEFGQESPRYTPPKSNANIFQDHYFLEASAGAPGHTDHWAGPTPASAYGYGTPAGPMGPACPTAPNLAQAVTYSSAMHLTEHMGYGTMSPSQQQQDSSTLINTSLPPMSSFRGPASGGAPPGAAGPSATPAAATPAGAAVPTPSPFAGATGGSPVAPPPPQTSGETINKALASIYPADQSASSYSSNPSTPVSSPPPLTNANGPWPPSQGPNPSSPHFISDRSNLAMVSSQFLQTPCQSLFFSYKTARVRFCDFH
ncbi:Hypothetical predicted protein [Cloeon dipterum]|uniref:Uncharacterized protein n=1 Tax=Cloeon dipterum TaxID=197152 RepID=A0A8S1CB28_9INSE|nr:Hypothetical predicted protein [Cloeon dipterum]